MAKHQHPVRCSKSPHKELSVIKANAEKVGQAPGTLLYVGDRVVDQTQATYIEYDPHYYQEVPLEIKKIGRPSHKNAKVSWVKWQGLENVELLQEIGRYFGLHPLVLEDILNTELRPKIDIYPDYIFIVARLVSWNQEEKTVESEQLSIVLGKNWGLTFQEKESEAFSEIQENIQSEHTVLRTFGADYLMYALLDKVVDRYFTVLEGLGEAIELIEDKMIVRSHQHHLHTLHALRREILHLRRSLWPLRDMINIVQRDEINILSTDTQLYLHDVYDHTIHLIESLESLRELIGTLQETHMSSQANNLNHQMRLLTVITTMFMPLTLISGIYGMNFKNMPELEWDYGYFMVLGMMVAILLGMGYFFWKKQMV